VSRVQDRRAISYVLPLRWTTGGDLPELAEYLRWLGCRAEVLVVDGSPPAVYARHHEALRAHVRHLPPDPRLGYVNGKVNGVLTGVREATNERVVIADDDVRYDAESLERMAELLGAADVVRPQNYFAPAPWHAVWDSGRSLINRALGGDYPGTLGVRRSVVLATGGYDGDVLFENLELIRTLSAAGGREVRPMDLFVRRLPPTTRHFLSQRVRQAYDDLALPLRLTAFLALLPALALTPRRRRGPLAAGVLVGAAALAEAGRRRGGARRHFPARCALCAPAWVIERALTSWLALGACVALGGVPYAGGLIRRAATPPRELRRRHARHGAAAPTRP
jgi:hypothetical protein